MVIKPPDFASLLPFWTGGIDVKHRRWRNILVSIRDPFATQQSAAVKAAAIARRCGARVLLLNTFMIPQPVADVPMGDHRLVIASATAQRKARLQQIARHLRLPGRVSCEVRWEYPQHEAIVRQVQHGDSDLVMMESHRHGHIARWLLSNSDWELIRACPCPVWFVRHGELRRSPRILAAVDPMHRRAKPAQLDSELLRVASAVANELRGSVGVVHACEVLDEGSGQTAKDSQEMITARLATVTLAATYSVPADDCIIAAGEPAAVIAKVVRRDQPDVLVMGALSRSELGRDVVGRTAERTLDDVDCDVLVVKRASASGERRAKVRAKSVSQPKRARSRRAAHSTSATVG